MSEFEPIEESLEETDAPLAVKPKYKGKASAQVVLHYVPQCILNFVATHDGDTVKPAKSALIDHDLSDANLRSILENETLTPKTNHIIRWLLKIPYTERTSWQA